MHFSYKGYHDVSEIIDLYVETLVRMETNRRVCNAPLPFIKAWFKEAIADHPISHDYFYNAATQLYLIESSTLWDSIERELTFTPSGQFLMWHVDRGLWKMISSGVDSYVR